MRERSGRRGRPRSGALVTIPSIYQVLLYFYFCVKLKTSAVSTIDGMVETQFCKLRGIRTLDLCFIFV